MIAARIVKDPARWNSRLLILMTAFQCGIFILPVMIPYYRDEIGLGFREFILGEVFFSAIVLLMEVPTGWLSDVWHRKRTMMLGFVFYLLGFGWLLFAKSFPEALLAQGVIGIGVSLISGTNSAFLYDSLLSANRAHEFRAFEGLRMGVSLYAIGMASLAGGFLYQIDHHLPLAATLLCSALGMACTTLMIEPARTKAAAEKHPLADMLDTLRYALHGHAEIAGIIFFATVAFSATKILLWVQQPYFIMMGLPEAWFGVFSAAGFLLGGLAGHFGHHIDGRFRNRVVFVWILAAELVICAVAGFGHGYFVIPFLIAQSLLFGFGMPRVQAAINKRVSSERRATILSAASLMINMAFMPLGAAAGAIEPALGIRGVLLALGAYVTIAGGASLWFVFRGGRGA